MYCVHCGGAHTDNDLCSCWPTVMMPYVFLSPIPQMSGPEGHIRAEWSRQPGAQEWHFSWLADPAEA
jgi:hypothetical protein